MRSHDGTFFFAFTNSFNLLPHEELNMRQKYCVSISLLIHYALKGAGVIHRHDARWAAATYQV